MPTRVAGASGDLAFESEKRDLEHHIRYPLYKLSIQKPRVFGAPTPGVDRFPELSRLSINIGGGMIFLATYRLHAHFP